MATERSDSMPKVEPEDSDTYWEEMLHMEIDNPHLGEEGTNENINKGASLDTILNICPHPPYVRNMEEIKNDKSIFMISPFHFDPSQPEREPTPIYSQNRYDYQGDMDHVHMPYSKYNVTTNKESIWLMNRKSLIELKSMCDNHLATVDDLKRTIGHWSGHHDEMGSLEMLINEVYSNDERAHFLSSVLSNICTLAVNVDITCTRPPPLLHVGSSRSVTMSQRQAASLLACAFFCLFPSRSNRKNKNIFSNFPNPNFNSLYQAGHPRKMEKLKCIFNYFRRITEKMPNGVITIRRFRLPNELFPRWIRSTTTLCDLHLTTGIKIEDVKNTLQVDFANKYIGGGVLGSGCVQEEIRFSICPEMLVSLLVCEKMETNECIFLIGCERYSSYKGYANTFQFDGDYQDNTPKDGWGRKWCHLVAMDAIFFRDASKQYDMGCVDRELLKAYTSFRPLGQGPDHEFGIATGNWGCGAFNGDKQLKAMIQLMAASEARRPLIYAAYWDTNLVNAFTLVYDVLKDQKATVGDLYRYLQQHLTQMKRGSLFEYILNTPISFLRS